MLDTFLRQALLLVQPIGLLWLCLILLALVLFRKRRWKSAIFASLLTALVTLCGCTDFPGWLLRGLERPWAGVKLADLPVCDAVVVLGGGAEPSRFEAGGVHLTTAGDRIIMGAELIRLGKAPVLALGGNAVVFEGQKKVEADLVKGLLESWKFPSAEIVSLGENANTRQEAEKVRALVDQRGWKRVLLVTSANHMTRAAAVFRTLGIDVVPAPCNFLTTVSTAPDGPIFTIPNWAGFEKIGVWAHERTGWWIYHWRGWIQ